MSDCDVRLSGGGQLDLWHLGRDSRKAEKRELYNFQAGMTRLRSCSLVKRWECISERRDGLGMSLKV